VKFIGNPLLKRFHPLFVLLPFIIPDFAFFADAGFTVLFALFRFRPRPRSMRITFAVKEIIPPNDPFLHLKKGLAILRQTTNRISLKTSRDESF
jgi:hypothetical protein